jgi:DNA-binding MarR family transcriptional regulator
MSPERLSALQQRILAWLQAHEQRTRGTMSASYSELVQALGHEKGNLSHSLRNLEAKGLVRLNRTAGGKAEALDLTPQGRKLVAHLAGSCE